MQNQDGAEYFDIRLGTKALQRDARNAQQQFAQIGNTAVQQGAQIDRAFGGMSNSVARSVNTMASGVKSALTDIAKNITGITALMASGSFIKDLYDETRRFGGEMRTVSTISDEVTADMQGWKDKIVDLTTQYAILPSQAAQAMYQINSAGHLGAAGLQVLEASMKSAIGGSMDAAQGTVVAADAITTVLNAYSLSADHAEEISDKFFTTVRLGKTTLDEIGRSIAMVAPQAAAYGISIDEVLTGIAELTKQGNSTQNSVTQISAAITAIGNEFGDKAFEHGLFAAMDKVAEIAAGSNTALKAQLGNIRALRAALSTTGSHAAETKQMLDEIGNSAGAITTAYDKMSKSAGSQMTILKNHFFKEFASMGDSATDVLNDIAKTMNNAFETGSIERVKEALLILISTYGAYKAIIMTTAAAQQWGTLADAARYRGLLLLEAAQKAVNFAMNKAPYAVAATVIATLAVGIYKLCTHTSELEKQMTAANEAIKNTQVEASKEIASLSKLRAELEKAKKGTDEWNKAKGEIVSKYSQYFPKLNEEIEKVGDLSTSYDILAKNIMKATAARQLQKYDEENAPDADATLKAIQNVLSKEEVRIFNGAGKGWRTEKLSESKREELMLAASKAATLGDTSAITPELKNILSNNKDGVFSVGTLYEKLMSEVNRYNEHQQGRQKIADRYGIDLESLDPKKEPTETKQEPKKEPANPYQSEEEKKKALAAANKAIEAANKVQKAHEAADMAARQQAIETEEARIATLKDGGEKELAQINLNYQKALLATEQKEREMVEQLRDVREAEYEQRNPKGKFDRSSVTAADLSDEQKNQLRQLDEYARQERQNALDEMNRAELESMNAYLRQYGDIQQQKLAITEEYSKKIAKATNQWDKKTLEQERDAALRQIEMTVLEADIDWAQIYSSLGGVASELLQPAIDEIESLMSSPNFKNMSADNKKAYAEALAKLKDAAGSNGIGAYDFSKLGELTKAWQESIRALNNAQTKQKEASEALEKAAEEYHNAAEEDKPQALEAYIKAQQNKAAADQNVTEAKDNNKGAGKNLSEAQNDLQESVDGVTRALSNLSSGTLTGFMKGLEGVIGAAKGTGDSFKLLSGKVGGLIGAILQVLDAMGDKPTEFITDLFGKVSGAVGGILNELASGELLAGIGSGVLSLLENAVSGIVKVFTLGSVDLGNFFTGSNAKEVQKTTDRLTASNDRLRNSVDSLKEEIKASGARAIEAAEKASGTQQTINEQTMEILKAQMGYHDSHRSNRYYWNLGYSDYASLNRSLADFAAKNPNAKTTTSSVWSLDDIYKLTPEQMDYIRDTNVKMWETMLSQGKYDKSEYWEAYADLAGQLEDITEGLKEALTQTSFDSLRDEFVNSLMDMDKSASAFADDFSTMLMKAVINAKVSDLMDEQLQEFYDHWADYSESDNELTEAEIANLRDMWSNITDQGIKLRNEVAKVTGYDTLSSQQDGTKGSFEGMSQDLGMELNGRFTSLQMNTQVIADGMAALDESHRAQLAQITANRAINEEIRNLSLLAIDHLETISKNTHELFQINERLDKIERNTRKI